MIHHWAGKPIKSDNGAKGKWQCYNLDSGHIATH